MKAFMNTSCVNATFGNLFHVFAPEQIKNTANNGQHGPPLLIRTLPTFGVWWIFILVIPKRDLPRGFIFSFSIPVVSASPSGFPQNPASRFPHPQERICPSRPTSETKDSKLKILS